MNDLEASWNHLMAMQGVMKIKKLTVDDYLVILKDRRLFEKAAVEEILSQKEGHDTLLQ